MSSQKNQNKKQKTQHLSTEEAKELVRMEGELRDLREKHGLDTEKTVFERVGEKYFAFKEAHTTLNPVKRSTYLWLCLGSVFGLNQFYARHYVKGLLYLALCWTGISIAFGFIDWMIALPKEPDENGMILI